MKIQNNPNLEKVQQSPDQNPVTTPSAREKKTETVNGERTQVSRMAQQLADAKAHASELPDVRHERVLQAKERLENGYYDNPEVRDNLIDRVVDFLRGRG